MDFLWHFCEFVLCISMHFKDFQGFSMFFHIFIYHLRRKKINDYHTHIVREVFCCINLNDENRSSTYFTMEYFYVFLHIENERFISQTTTVRPFSVGFPLLSQAAKIPANRA